MGHWAIDLGTTNTGVARWDADARRPVIVDLPGISRPVNPDRPLDAAGMVPTATQLKELDVAGRLGSWSWFRKHTFVGVQADIGWPALRQNEGWPSPSYSPTFKAALARDASRPVARLGNQSHTARDVARAFFRELLRHVSESVGERPRELVLTAPIGSYDGYRAELRDLAHHVGVRSVRFLDEPVAAAIGYGVGLAAPRNVLIFDMGGGTLHACLVRLDLRVAEAGTCEVLGKDGRSVGGNLVDRWILESVCQEVGVTLDPDPGDETLAMWQRFMLAEARRVKEEVHFEPRAAFTFTAPEELRGVRARLSNRPASVEFSRERLTALLEARGLYPLIAETVDAAVARADVDEVLLVGGSTLLPGIFPYFEQRFGRDRVRGWQPFESVVLGGAVYAAGAIVQADFIVHDYAILTHDEKTGKPAHTVIIPSGTRFPTAPDHWHRQLVPTCALGEPETIFKLVVAEIGRHGDDARRFGWDASGNLRPMAAPGATDIVVSLNATNPTLGILEPPHRPSDRRPRLDVCFGVSADRWLVATVRDLYTHKLLLDAEPVVRLL